jgi:hypothetical protein
MSPIVRLWLATALLLGSMMLVCEWLVRIGASAASRFALALAVIGVLLPAMRRWWQRTVHARAETSARTLPAKETSEVGCGCGHADRSAPGGWEMSADLGLAADHVESIRTLLEVSEAHRHPIPRAAFQNLELVSKHLRGVQRSLESHRPGESSGPLLSAKAESPARQGSGRLRPRQLSF